MLSRWKSLLASAGCLGLVFCGGGSGEGGKSSDAPLVVALNASPSPAWLNAAVTFSATCISATNSSSLSLTWKFGDGHSDTTIVATAAESAAATDVHNYTAQGSYAFSVTCTDPVSGASVTAPSQSIKVSNYDLNVVAKDVCSSGFQGFGWCWQNPLPTGSNLRAVAVVSPLTAWTVGDGGTVLETNNGGIDWQAKYPKYSGDFLAIQASDQNNAVVIARDGSLLSTSDAGLNWSRISPTTRQALTNVSIVSPEATWAITANDGIVETLDGGSSWSEIPMSGLPAGSNLSAIAGSNGATAWVVGAVGDSGLIGQTVDGRTWTPQEFAPATLFATIPPLASLEFSSVALAGSSRCGSGATTPSVWVGGYGLGSEVGSTILRSLSLESIGGSAFKANTSGGGPLIWAFDSKTAWATAVVPGFLDFQPFPNELQNQLAAINDPIGISVTADGNASWTTALFAFSAPIALTALDSSDCISGFAVGNGGVILATMDGAKTWSSQSLSATGAVGGANLVSVSASSGALAYALESQPHLVKGLGAAESLAVFATTDGGINWSAQTPAVVTAQFLADNVPPFQLLPPPQVSTNGVTTVAVGPGFIISSSNGTWDLCSGCYNDESRTLWSVGPQQNCLPIFSQGATPFISSACPVELWTGVSLTASSAWVTDIFGDILEEDLPFPAGSPQWNLIAGNPHIQSWITLSSYPPFFPLPDMEVTTAIAAIDRTTAVVVGSGGLIWWTNNKGNSWTQAVSGTTSTLDAISIATTGDLTGAGWAVGADGIVLRTTDSGQHWTSQTWSDTTVTFTAVSTPDGKSAWAIGQTNSGTPIVIYTSDAGSTWTAQKTGAQALTSVRAVDPNTAWIVGPNGAILKTLTGGNPPPSN